VTTRPAVLALAVLALGLSACGSSTPTVGARPSGAVTPSSNSNPTSTTTSTPPAAAGVQEADSAIPWSEVGPGWQVALWGPNAAVAPGTDSGDSSEEPTTLFLLDPSGGRYLVTTLPAPSEYTLSDWSGDGHRVLLLEPGGTGGSTFDEVDLTTGHIVHTVTESGEATALFTRPTGQSLLVWTPAIDQSPSLFVRTSWSGAVELPYPDSYPGLGQLATSFLPGLDGTQLVVGTSTGMALIDNDGTFVRAVGPAGRICTPTRWWDTTDFVASCLPPTTDPSGTPSLWLVPVTGPAATQLTSPQPPDAGDMNGWRVGTTTYVQAAGACGTEYLARRNPDGSTSKVSVPGAEESVQVVGAHGSELSLLALLACGPGTSLFWFDPTTAAEMPLLGPAVNGGSVSGALPYPGLQT
jgi:TolB protein